MQLCYDPISHTKLEKSSLQVQTKNNFLIFKTLPSRQEKQYFITVLKYVYIKNELF